MDLKKDDISMVKDVILGVKAPSLYGSTLQHCFTMEGNLSRLKSHDHLNLLTQPRSSVHACSQDLLLYSARRT
jgi:hypothetical protein